MTTASRSLTIRPRSDSAPRPVRRRWYKPAGSSGGVVGRDTRLIGLGFIAPGLLLTGLFSIYPLIMVIHRSLYLGNVFGTNLKYVGLQNYRTVFSSGGTHALVVTVEYTVAFVLVCMALGLGVALLLDVKLPGLKSVRAFFIIPVVVPAVATALIWFTLFEPGAGLINRIAPSLGLPQFTLTGSKTAMVAIIAFGAWQFFGEVVILYLAGLKALPGELMEAAGVDGAGPWSRFRFVRWPLLRRDTAVIAVVATLTGLQAFTQIYVLTQGGPGTSTQTALYYIFNQAFGTNAANPAGTGQADAMAVILFGISLLVAILQLAVIGRSATRER